MQTAFRRALLLSVGVLFLACGRQAPDRANAVQVPLLLLVLVAPALSHVIRRRGQRLRIVGFLAQLGLYVLYETGVSVQTDIRVDLLLLYPAILLNALISLRGIAGSRSAR